MSFQLLRHDISFIIRAIEHLNLIITKLIIKRIYSMLKTLLLLLVLISSSVVNAQTDSTKSESSPLKKNSLYISLGVATEFYYDGIVTYERLFWQSKKATHIAIGGQIGYGYYAVWGIGGSVINANLLLLTGAGNHHLEVTGGMNFYLSGDMEGYNPYKLSTTVGYRLQKPSGGILLRVGSGWPRIAYVGLGYNF